jgi:hypothetical protein
MNYQESMSGIDQLFNALVQQQQRPVQVEVDEMQRPQAVGMEDMLRELQGVTTGLENQAYAQTQEGNDGKGFMDSLMGLFG